MQAQQLRKQDKAFDLEAINRELHNADPTTIIEWAVNNACKPVLSTNFRPLSAALLHMVTRIKPDIQVIWVDSGYNTVETYRFAEQVMKTLDLNMRIFTPKMTTARREAILGGVPELDDVDKHDEFTHEVKLEPFEHPLDRLQPDVWLTAIRRDQTEYRKHLDIATPGPHGVLRIAPLFLWTDVDLEGYIYDHQLPDNHDYVDPTKVRDDRECGLQTLK